jgi:hypothetical protein
MFWKEGTTMADDDDGDDRLPTISVADISIAVADPSLEIGPNGAVWCPLSEFPDEELRMSRAVKTVYVIVQIGQCYRHIRVDVKHLHTVPLGVRWRDV